MRNHIKILALLTVMALSAVALAAGTLSYQYTSDGTGVTGGSVLPGPSMTLGVPLMVSVPTGLPTASNTNQHIKSVTVTISDFRDGGASDFQQVGNGRLIALISKAGARDPDGGAQWARYPAFDIEVDGGNPFIPGGGGAITYSAQLNSANLGLGAGRLLYYSQAVVAADGGALPHKVLIEAHY